MSQPKPLRYIALPNPLPGYQLPSPPQTFTDKDGTAALPCRRCLLDTRATESVHLISYNHFPATTGSPYRHPGPIFVHTHDCAPFTGTMIPDSQLQRLMSLRGYTKEGMMRTPYVASGKQFEEVARTILEDSEVEYVDVHNAAAGCFALRVERGGEW